jgi:hypothetical protein
VFCQNPDAVQLLCVRIVREPGDRLSQPSPCALRVRKQSATGHVARPRQARCNGRVSHRGDQLGVCRSVERPDQSFSLGGAARLEPRHDLARRSGVTHVEPRLEPGAEHVDVPNGAEIGSQRLEPHTKRVGPHGFEETAKRSKDRAETANAYACAMNAFRIFPGPDPAFVVHDARNGPDQDRPEHLDSRRVSVRSD